MGAKDHAGQPTDQEDQRQPVRPGQMMNLLGLTGMGRGGALAPFGPVVDAGHGKKYGDHEGALPGGDGAVPGKADEQQADADDDGAVAMERAGPAQDRGDQPGGAEDEQDVGDVAADHVADGDGGEAGERRLEADHELRSGRAVGDDRESDHHGRNAEPAGQSDRPAHHELGARQQQDQPGRD